MMYYVRVVFEANSSVAEKHDDMSSARSWIEEERCARPEAFRLGQIIEDSPGREIVATCDATGWISS
jgi:hypothetical protein